MGQFNAGNKHNPTNYLSADTHWQINQETPNSSATTVALVHGAQLITPHGITLTFKKGAILSFNMPICFYQDNDLR